MHDSFFEFFFKYIFTLDTPNFVNLNYESAPGSSLAYKRNDMVFLAAKSGFDFYISTAQHSDFIFNFLQKHVKESK